MGAHAKSISKRKNRRNRKKLTSWYNIHPTTKKGIELIGGTYILTGIEPQDTQFGGMKIVTIADKNNPSKIYRVMMTTQDLDYAVELFVYSGDACFTFQPSERNPSKYAEVCKISKGGK